MEDVIMPVGNDVLVVVDAKSVQVDGDSEGFLASSSDLTQFTFHMLLLYYLQSHEAVLILS
jgi:hypothetical protein